MKITYKMVKPMNVRSRLSHHLRVEKNALNEYDQYAIYLAILNHGAIGMFSVCSHLQ